MLILPKKPQRQKRTILDAMLDGDLGKSFEDEDAGTVQNMLDAMQLPTPKDGEYCLTWDSFLIPLSRYGLILKVMNLDEYHNISSTRESDLALQPFKMHKLSAGAFAVIPGVRLLPYGQHTKIDEEIAYIDFMHQETRNLPFTTNDLSCNNIGLLPATYLIHGAERAFPSIIDYGSVSATGGGYNLTALSNRFNSAAYCGIQQRTFKPVTERLRDAWPDSGTPSPAAMRKFFNCCAEITALPEHDPKRLLVPGWQMRLHSTQKTRDANFAAQNYEKRLQGSPLGMR